jgi:HlyD family secretion protein
MLWVALGLFYINVHKTIHTMIVEARSESTSIYFPGVVNPLGFYTVLSPIDGVINEVKIDYGQRVKRGDLIYTLTSSQLADNYRQSIEDLVKSMKSYQNLLFKNNGNTQMYNLGLISKVAYLDSNQQLQNAELELYESKQRLIKLLTLTGQKTFDFEHISPDKMESVRALLQAPLKNVNIIAPEDGILFFPSKSFSSASSGGDDKASKITRGSIIKDGQILAIIGNLSGAIFGINVNEIDFHKLSIGEKATITGAAFPGITLQGTIKSINRQANSSDAGTTPLYSIEVIVPDLTEADREVIQVGMSAEIAFTTMNPPAIRIPLDALIEKNDAYWVKVVDKSGTVNEVAVTPGLTDISTVQIVKGLSSGDRIVISD